MNTLRTGHRALEIDNRERYRELLIASQRPKDSYHYDFHGEPTTWVDILGLTIFAAGMLALLGYGLMWILG